MIATAAALLASCGIDAAATETTSVRVPATAPTPPTGPSVTATSPAAPTPTVPAPAVAATVTSTPERLDRPPLVLPPHDGRLDVAWIGGSDVELGDVSLPAVAAMQFARIGGDSVSYTTFTGIAPDPATELGWFDDALAAGAEAVIMSVTVSWLYGRECADVTPAYARYACLLAPVEPARGEELRGRVADLLRVVADSGIPTVVVVTPHSATAMADPTLGPLIATAESSMVALVPSAPNIHVVSGLTRGRPGFEEGDGYVNIVHPTQLGAQRLVAALFDDVSRWWFDIGVIV